MIRTVQVNRYITPLREGGSLPALTSADDGFMYVLKFRGAGQGIKSLIAEFIGGEIARALQLKIPEIVFAELNEAFGRTEPDEEIQDLLKASTGLNLGLHFLEGAATFDPVVNIVDPLLASKIVWLDAFLLNVDRTCRNTNMLIWKKELWLIDNGAALFFHHSWQDWEEKITSKFSLIKNHALLPMATRLTEANEFCSALLTPAVIQNILFQLPDEWLQLADHPFETTAGHSNAYATFLNERLANTAIFIQEAQQAQHASL